MLEKTTQLFLKALIIGVLVNMTLQQVSAKPLPSNQNISRCEHQQPLSHSSVDTIPGSFDPIEK
jgi:hypothetical protein